MDVTTITIIAAALTIIGTVFVLVRKFLRTRDDLINKISDMNDSLTVHQNIRTLEETLGVTGNKLITIPADTVLKVISIEGAMINCKSIDNTLTYRLPISQVTLDQK